MCYYFVEPLDLLNSEAVDVCAVKKNGLKNHLRVNKDSDDYVFHVK
jgi:hypothetical protein